MSTTAREAEEQTTVIDPVTFEVIRHRLLGITDEQAARLQSISGSKNVTEISDFNVGIYLPDGAVATMGRTLIFHASSMATILRHVMEDCSENPGIGPGDMFVANNPWKGALHGPDMAIVAPIFDADRLIAWSGGIMHMADIGGIGMGGLGLNASETYQEGLLLPPVKLVESGVLREDIWNLILTHSRMAPTMSLDLKGLMASNYAAQEGLSVLIDRYGVETLQAVMAGLINLSEERFRRRIRELPDATVSSIGYFEYNQTVKDYPQVTLELTKAGDELIFDFSKSSEQVPDSSNCTYAGLMAGISAALFPTLCYDIPWNDGLYRPVKVICPEGKICNARRPAAVSGNISGSVWEVQMTGVEALSKLAACSDAYLPEAEAGAAARPAGGESVYGVNQNGEGFHAWRYELLATGGGAYYDHDGVSTQGHHDIERVNISNIESLELDLPVLYLYRGLAPDGAGAGRYRGGLSIGLMTKPHKAKRFFATLGQQIEMPDSFGIFGGFPPPEDEMFFLRDSDVDALMAAGSVPTIDALSGERVSKVSDAKGTEQLGESDVIWAICASAAGWGDPLERTVDRLQDDLDSGAVSVEMARRLYGIVASDDGVIDEAGTKKRRAELREGRKSWPVPKRLNGAAPQGELARVCPLGDAMEIVRDDKGEAWVRCSCGCVLSAASDNWREYAGHNVAVPDELGAWFRVPERFEMREFSCTNCGRLHAVELYGRDEADRHDVRLVL